MLTHLEKTPWPYFGGKADAAEEVWTALGDVAHFVDPFMGSLAVLLRRPHPCNRPYSSETVNDVDGMLCNAWRAIQLSPDATAEAASYPVSEIDLTARHLALVRWRESHDVEHLLGDPFWHDPVMAGWWIWGMSCWIASGWCTGTGAWTADAEGRLYRQDRGPSQNREPGVSRKRTHMGHYGQGVNHADTREPGVGDTPDFHPMTMPEVRRWFQFLSARLRHVRILCGDWRRAMTPAVLQTIPVRMHGGTCGIFLDPPYGEAAGRDPGIYTHDSLTVASDVQEWCLTQGNDPHYRIVLAGFSGEHDLLAAHGWREVEWFRTGYLRGGMNMDKTTQKRERLWLSPHTLRPPDDAQGTLFGTSRSDNLHFV